MATTLITGYVDNGHYMIALKCFEEMQEVGVSPNTITFSCVLKACCSIGALDKGRDFHNEIAMKGLLSNSSVSISLISMYTSSASLRKQVMFRDCYYFEILHCGLELYKDILNMNQLRKH